MKRGVISLLVVFAFLPLRPQFAHAASAFKTLSGLGSGDETIPGTCADITCTSGHSCFCAEATDLPFSGTAGLGAGTVHIEMLMDNSTQTGNIAGICENAGGLMVFTSKNGKNTLTFGLAGTYCQTDPHNFAVATVTGGFNILSGGGSFSKAGGSGVFSFGGPTLDQVTTGPSQIQLTGSFNKTAPTAIRATESAPPSATR